MIYTNIHTLELELSSSCNAGCCVCPRYIEHNNGLYENPFADLNQHLTVEIIEDIMTGFPMSDHVKVDCIGTVGDPLANKNIVELVKRIVEHKPKCELQIHTNGSLRNTKTFSELASLVPLHSSRKIVFSIDGLEDTNHLYRKNVSWDRVMANSQAFIKAGGRAEWKVVEFNHNKHQIKEIKELARSLGFKGFQTTPNQSPDEIVDRTIVNGENILDIYKRAPTIEDGYKDDDPIETVEPNTVVEPQCELGQYIHIRGDGLVFPCCMTAGNFYNPTSWIRNDVMSLMSLPSHWNNLHKRSFSEILNSSEWTSIQNNYKSKNPCWTCADSCGVDNKSLNPADHIIREKVYE